MPVIGSSAEDGGDVLIVQHSSEVADRFRSLTELFKLIDGAAVTLLVGVADIPNLDVRKFGGFFRQVHTARESMIPTCSKSS